MANGLGGVPDNRDLNALRGRLRRTNMLNYHDASEVLDALAASREEVRRVTAQRDEMYEAADRLRNAAIDSQYGWVDRLNAAWDRLDVALAAALRSPESPSPEVAPDA